MSNSSLTFAVCLTMTTDATTDATTEAETMLHIKQLVHSAMQERVSAITGSHAAIPFVTLTYAQSIDGSIAAVRGSPTLLSGARSMQMTHMLRTMHDAILVGVGTILADNPSLNARFAEGECGRAVGAVVAECLDRIAHLHMCTYLSGRNPKPVIVDTSLRCPLTIKLFTSSACEKPVILCGDTSASTGECKRAFVHVQMRTCGAIGSLTSQTCPALRRAAAATACARASRSDGHRVPNRSRRQRSSSRGHSPRPRCALCCFLHKHAAVCSQ